MKTHDLIHEITNTGAIFGRKDVLVVFEGDGAYTDGEQIVLPAIPHGADVSHETMMAMRGYLDHEAGHVRHTDFEVFKKFASTCSPEAKHIHNCLEDMWLEQKVMSDYPGAKKNLTALTQTVGAKEQEHINSNKDHYSKFNVDSVSNAILRSGRLDYGGQVTKDMFEAMPTKLKEWGLKWAELAHNASGTKELINLALEIEKLIEKTPPDADPEEDKAEGKGLEGSPEDFTFDPNGDVTEGKEPNKGADKQESKSKIISKELSDLMGDILKEEADNYYKDHPKKGKYQVLTTRYDEVFVKGQASKRSTSISKVMQATSVTEYEKIKANLNGVVNTMKARLRRALMAKEMRDWDYGREQGRLDSKRLVAGFLGAPNVYKVRKDREELDTAVHFLIDLSGSMRGHKVSVAGQSIIALCECLEGTQIRYQVSGFDNSYSYSDNSYRNLYDKAVDGRRQYSRVEPLNLYKFKRFEEPLQTARGPIASISNACGGNNSDRDAVLWAYKQLTSRPEKRKILFVLSDGQPENEQLNGRINLTQHLKDAVQEAIKAGIECVGIGIQDSTVNQIYPKSVSINRVEDLSGTIFTQLSNLLTGGKVVF